MYCKKMSEWLGTRSRSNNNIHQLLQDLDAPGYKIASFEFVDLPLIKIAAECVKPLLMSTGMSSASEVKEALDTALKYGSGEALLFHCISSYPAALKDSNLKSIEFLSKQFSVEVGLSDHTLTNLAVTLAIGMGASPVEKHFKLSSSVTGPDASFSITPNLLRQLVSDCNVAWGSLGTFGLQRSESEKTSLKHRRSLYFMKDLTTGSLIQPGDIRAIRSGNGISPKYANEIIGRCLRVDVERGDPVLFEVF
jgi:sialic acid synthase SpsE